MGEAFARYLATRSDIAGIVGIGGGGGTSIVTAGMRGLPVGLPKLMVSTLAAGDVSQFVGAGDITMMYSVTDVAGLNRISRVVLGNAAHAIAGMAMHKVPEAAVKPAIGLTMFGVTTACVTQVVAQLEDRYDCLVFHATGTGGRSMEKLADSGMLKAVIDVTTTEVCDHLVGGVLSAGPDRLGAIARSRIPYVGSVGALDMVNFWAMDTVPERFRRRNLYKHNPNVTLMRTTASEMPGDRHLDCGTAQCLRGSGALSDPGERRVGAGCAGPGLLRPGGRRRAVPVPGDDAPPDAVAPANASALSHQRPAVFRGAGGKLPRNHQIEGSRACPPSKEE